MSGTLVVGASQAGLQVAISLRELGDDGPITVVGGEGHLPYQRPPLSKTFLAGDAEPRSLAFRTPGFYREHRLDLLCGERVDEVLLASDGSGTAATDRGRVLAFDRLALTVGAQPRQLAVPGSDLDGVCYLRDVEDALTLRRRLREAGRVVVVGGGYIGLEAAAAARTTGKAVTVVEAADRLLSRSVAPLVSEFYRCAHTRRGTAVRLGAGVAAIRGTHGRVSGVELDDGSRLPADLVLVGIGVVPRTELAQQMGLACDRGIVVDEYARTSDPAVVAAGDCTTMPEPATGERLVRLESVQNAVGQARVAAASLRGRTDRYADVPWFWSDQYDLKLQIAGLTQGYDQVVLRGERDEERFSVLYFRDGRLLGADAVNRAADYLVVRRALARGATVAAERAGDVGVPLRQLVVDPAGAGR